MPPASPIDWSDKDGLLRAMKAQGISRTSMADTLGISRGAVYHRLRELGLAPVPPSLVSRKRRAAPPPPRVAPPPPPEGGIICPKRIVLKMCAEAFRVSVSQLTGPKRHRSLIIARHATCYVLRHRFADMSFPRIGRMMGGRDHSTIIYACTETENRMRRDPQLAALVRALVTPPHDAHVETRRIHLLRQWESTMVTLSQAEEAESRRRAQLAAEDRHAAADARALAVIEGPVKVFCTQCDRRRTLPEARACASRFCGLKADVGVAA